MKRDPQLLLSSHFHSGDGLYSFGSLGLFSDYLVFFGVEISKCSSGGNVKLLLYAATARQG